VLHIMHAVRQATWRLTLVWILYLWVPQGLQEIQQELAAAKEIPKLVAKEKDWPYDHY
jgi:hypothetical protein